MFARLLFSLKIALGSYAGFKFVTALLLNLSLALAFYSVGSRQVLLETVDALETATRFMLAFWWRHALLASILMGVIVILFAIDCLWYPFHKGFRNLPFRPASNRSTGILRWSNAILVVLIAAQLFVNVPLLHLRMGGLGLVTLYAFVLTIPYFLYVVAFGDSDLDMQPVRAIATHDFQFKTFDVAGIGVLSYQAERELQLHLPFRGGHDPKRRFEYLVRGDPDGQALWKGYTHFGDQVSSFLKLPDAQRIRLFTSTTEAIAHALFECVRTARVGLDRHVRLLGTDAEYESVVTTLKRIGAEDEVRLLKPVKLRKAIMAGGSSRDIATRVVAELHNKQPDVFCMSHVFAQSGFVVPILEILTALDGFHTQPLVVVDGAQAVGQIHVEREIFDRATRYATSGHKWLLSKETLGMLIDGETFQKMRRIPSLGSLSEWKSTADLEAERAATINPESRLTLHCSLVDFERAGGAVTIEAHIRSLTKIFRRRVSDVRGLSVVPIASYAGMTILRAKDPDRIASDLGKRRYRIGARVLNSDGSGILRVCCHYFHSEWDVLDLVTAMADVV